MSKSIPGVIRDILEASGGEGGGGTPEATITAAIDGSAPATTLTSILAGIAAIQANLDPKLIRSASATISSDGDTTAIDISALTGYVAGDQIVIITAIVQTTVDSPESFVIENSGVSPTFVQRVYAPTIGTGLALPVEWPLPADTDLIVNKAGVVNSQYSFAYYLRQAV